jgi:hypothetical protein
MQIDEENSFDIFEMSPRNSELVAEHRVTKQEHYGCAICVNTSTTDQG